MYRHVQEFTRATYDKPIPRKLTVDELKLVSKLVVEELFELCEATCADSSEILMDSINSLKNVTPLLDSSDDNVVIAAQGDAMVDLVYVTMNAAAKTGIDLDEIFTIVHEANMKKVDPETGKVKRRPDGKILKPEGWEAPEQKVKRQRSTTKLEEKECQTVE